MATKITSKDWVPAVCTLPVVEQPLRVAEFDEFFRAALRGSIRIGTTRLELVILRECEATAHDLAESETSCCSFFGFDFETGEDVLMMRISVPDSHIGVLNALQARISAVVGMKTVNGDA